MERILPEEVKKDVETILTKLSGSVRMMLFVDENCDTCVLNERLYMEVVEASPKLQLSIHDLGEERGLAAKYGVDVAPTLVVTDEVGEKAVLFTGTPHGHEFSSLLDGMLAMSGSGTKLTGEIVKKIEAAGRTVTVQVFVSPTCPYCPMALKAAFPLAAATPKVRVQMIQATEFPEWAARKRVMGVPKLVVDDRIEIEGAVPTAKLVEAIASIRPAAKA
ncbi:MAG: thioredoxin family protein [bacterium]|jgi:glutaredoxin-like protein